MRREVVAVGVLMILLAGLSAGAPQAQMPSVETRPPNGAGQQPAFPGQTRASQQLLNVAYDVVTVADGLHFPWSLAFLPDTRMLVTERGSMKGPAQLRVLRADGTLSAPVAGLPAVDARAQGGLLDVAVAPDFAKSRLIYWSFSEPREKGENNTAVARARLVDDAAAPRVENVQVIYHQAPSMASPLHFGSRLVFGRDGTLFVTQGDRSITPGRMQAQNLDSLLGKIVRINPDGSIPKDNPFVGKPGARPEIWSSGHRNIQAATLHPATGELWEIEHGTRGGDELNISRKGRDYGWPTIAYGIEYRGEAITGGIQQKAGMEQPLYYWDPVIAPSGMIFYTGALFPAWRNSLMVGGLASQHVARLSLNGERVVGEERLFTELKQQIRDVRQGPDGALYLLTNHASGRVLKILPKPSVTP